MAHRWLCPPFPLAFFFPPFFRCLQLQYCSCSFNRTEREKSVKYYIDLHFWTSNTLKSSWYFHVAHEPNENLVNLNSLKVLSFEMDLAGSGINVFCKGWASQIFYQCCLCPVLREATQILCHYRTGFRLWSYINRYHFPSNLSCDHAFKLFFSTFLSGSGVKMCCFVNIRIIFDTKPKLACGQPPRQIPEIL